jgi:GH18 family chitinase
MTKNFERGAYYHTLKGIEVDKLDHATFLESDEITPDALEIFREKHPHLKLSLALDKEGPQRLSHRVKELTIKAHKGMDLEKECQVLLKKGFQVRVALPSNIELLKLLKLEAVAALDVKFDLMAFDYAHPSSSRTNFHTLLFSWDGPSVVQTLEFLQEQGVPLNKVSLGLASFGVLFKNVSPGMSNTGYSQPCKGDQLEKPEMSPVAIEKYLKTHPSAQLFYTFLGGCFQSFIYNEENGDWISFDDGPTLESKTSWARDQGLNGIFFYTQET